MLITEAKQVLKKYGKKTWATACHNEDFLTACKDGNSTLVEAYLSLGVDVNYQSTEYGQSIGLVKAAEGGFPDIIRLLVSHGADMSLVDEDGDTALHTAVNWGQKEVVETLIELGSPINTLNNKRYTPLTGALEHQKSDIYAILIQHADPNAYADSGNAFIQKCIQENWLARIPDAFKKTKIPTNTNLQNKNGESLLFYAISQLYSDEDHVLKVVKTLISAGANPNTPNPYGWTPYYLAKHFQLEKVCAFLKPKSDIELGTLKTDFFEALHTRSINSVQQCLSMGLDKDTRDPWGRNALAFVSTLEYTDLDFFQWLIAQGFQVNSFSQSGKNVLQEAYNHQKRAYIEPLLYAGANPNAADGNCYLVDLYHGEPEDITIFAKHGAHFGDLSDFISSFTYGKMSNKKLIAFIEALGKAKANLNAKDNFSTLFEELLTYKQDLALTQALVHAGADCNILNKYGANPIQELADYYQKSKKTSDLMKYLLELGADVDHEGGHGGNLATIVYDSYSKSEYTQKPYSDFLDKKLKEVQKKYKVSDLSQATQPFIQALGETFTYGHLCAWAYQKRWDIVDLLLQAGVPAQPQVPLAFTTALAIAVEQQNAEAVQILLQAGADPNYITKYGFCVFHDAIDTERQGKDRKIIIRYLLEAGADPNINLQKGYSSLIYTISAQDIESAELLLNSGCDFTLIKDCILPIAVKTGNLEVIQWVLDLGADIDGVGFDGNSAIQVAMNNGDKNLLSFILNLPGIDINQINSEGKTVLMLAIQEEEEELIQQLVSLGADINISDAEGNSAVNMVKLRPELAHLIGVDVTTETSLQLNYIWEEKPLIPIFKAIYERDYNQVITLIEQGTDLNETDYRGDTPMMVALITGQEDIASFLLKKGADPSIISPQQECASGHCQSFGEFESLKETLRRSMDSFKAMDSINGMAALTMNKEKLEKLWYKRDFLGVIKHIQKGKVNIVAATPYFFILHEAVKLNDIALVKALLEIGALKEAWDRNLNLPMDYAETEEMRELVRV